LLHLGCYELLRFVDYPTSPRRNDAQRGFSPCDKGSIFADGHLSIASHRLHALGLDTGFGRTGLEHETQGGSLMAIESHLAELEKRHQALEQEINDALTHPSTDDLKLVELKRRKLHVKDEITRLRQDVSIH
jgi:hypothetical protein